MTPASRPLTRGSDLIHLKIEAYTDGSCTNNGKLDTRCGSGIWICADHPLNRALKVPGPLQSNQVGELAAVIAATHSIPNYCQLTLITDSKYVIEGLTKHLKEWEDRGWIGIKNAEMFKQAAYLLKRRTGTTSFQWVKGHQGNLGNEESDKLAKEGADKDQGDELTLHIPDAFNLQGAKLATLTQAIAYKGIRESRTAPNRPSTNRNMDTMREAIMVYTGNCETDRTIWRSIRKRTIRIRVQQFLFKAMHNTLMIGDVWFKIPGFKNRGTCATCDTTETMEHILLACQANPVKIAWDLAKKLWPHRNLPWPVLSLGIILGCGCLLPKHEAQINQNEREQGDSLKHNAATRLLQITISETVHLIWVLRCERVIQDLQHSPREIKARWLKAINRRLTDDKITATKIKRKIPFTQLVEATWEEALRKSSDLPDRWIFNREVLVGRSAQWTQATDGDKDVH
ncbi:ribonuclease H-like protein [Lactarius vividus]|nr:ribonuclease H-like protein [Lactarius vividus]